MRKHNVKLTPFDGVDANGLVPPHSFLVVTDPDGVRDLRQAANDAVFVIRREG